MASIVVKDLLDALKAIEVRDSCRYCEKEMKYSLRDLLPGTDESYEDEEGGLDLFVSEFSDTLLMALPQQGLCEEHSLSSSLGTKGE